jgi:hypothetical protein
MESRAPASLTADSRNRPRGPEQPAGAPPASGRLGPGGRTPPGPDLHQAARRQRFGQRAALALLAGLCLVGVFALLPVGPGPGQAQGTVPGSGPASATPPALFRGWGRPDVALVVSGEQRGYLQPCGCSHPQLGGMARRYNFIQGLKRRGWPVVAVDLGDIAPRAGLQRMLKYVTAMKALDVLGYSAVGIGQGEMAMPLIEALGNYTLNNPSPRVLAANLAEREKGQLFHGLVDSWKVAAPPGAPRVGITSLIDRSVTDKVKDPNLKLAPRMRQVLLDLKAQRVDLVVLLYEGTLKEAAACAEFCARCRQQDATLPAVDVMLCLSGEDDEPPGVPDRVGRTLVVRLGHKSRYVGVLGAFRTGKADRPFDLRYQLVPIGEEYETAKGREATNPVMVLMEEYAKDVKRGNYLARSPRSVHPLQNEFPGARYVGSKRCANCHKAEYKVWKDSKHAHAYKTLVDTPNPSLRQYDPECVTCHVVGFAYKTGYHDEVTTPLLKDVGCESCHGPGSAHVADTDNLKIREAMNPWKAVPAGRLRDLQIDKFCQSCHDIDNDVHWDFTKNWPKVVHRMARRRAAAPAAQPEQPAPGPDLELQQAQPVQPDPGNVSPPPPPRRGFRLFRRSPGN